jgi:hypothetical protein
MRRAVAYEWWVITDLETGGRALFKVTFRNFIQGE